HLHLHSFPTRRSSDLAQPVEDCVETLCFSRGKRTKRLQDHIVYGIWNGNRLEVFPGALTRISATESGRTESEHGGGAKDTWILRSEEHTSELQSLAYL